MKVSAMVYTSASTIPHPQLPTSPQTPILPTWFYLPPMFQTRVSIRQKTQLDANIHITLLGLTSVAWIWNIPLQIGYYLEGGAWKVEVGH